MLGNASGLNGWWMKDEWVRNWSRIGSGWGGGEGLFLVVRGRGCSLQHGGRKRGVEKFELCPILEFGARGD